MSYRRVEKGKVKGEVRFRCGGAKRGASEGQRGSTVRGGGQCWMREARVF